MDYSKVHDPRFYNLNYSSIVHNFLDSKLEKYEEDTQEDLQLSSAGQSAQKGGSRKIKPEFRFRFLKHTVGECVEYEVELTESFKVFKREKHLHYTFTTRYSKLEKLSSKGKLSGFPPKKLFGNKNEDFIKQRKKDLQQFLNKAVTQNAPEVLLLIKQIKAVDFIKDSKRGFRL